jgi:heme/copper-type cytochrome/quinol oxidase subunit 4
MKTSSSSHLGQSIGFALVLALTSIGVIVVMSIASGQF